LAKYNFEIAFNVDPMPAIALFFVIAILTIVIGLLNSRGTLNRPPLEILRGE
jgi:putative ABC transport system permease protein